MPTPDEVADNLQRFGERSPFYAQVDEDARRAAEAALASHRRFEIESTGIDPFHAAPEQTQIVYLDYLRRARAARKLPVSMRMADVASVATADGEQTETGVLGGLGKGVEAGAMRVGSLVASPFVSEEQSAQNFAASNKRGSEVQGVPAEIAATIGQTSTEMAPLVAGALATGGALWPAVGASGARAGALAAASVGGGIQSGVPEYFERRGAGMSPDQAKEVAVAKGLSTTAVTALFGLTGAEALANPVAQKAIRTGIREYLAVLGKGAAKEGVEEATDEVFQTWADKALAGDPITAGDFVERAAKAGALGALFGGAGEVAAHARSRIQAPAAAPAPSAPSQPVQPRPAVPGAPGSPGTAPVSIRNVGVVLRGLLNGSVDPTNLAPEAQALVADTLRQQLVKGKPVPAQVQNLLTRLEPAPNAVVQPRATIVPMGKTGQSGPAQPSVAPIIPPVAAVASAPARPTVGPPANPAQLRPVEPSVPAAAPSVPAPAAPVASAATEPVSLPSPAPLTPVVSVERVNTLRAHEPDVQPVSGSSTAQSALVRKVPRHGDARMAEDAPADGRSLDSSKRSELREHVSATREAIAPTVPLVREPKSANASSGLQPAAASGVDVPAVSSSASSAAVEIAAAGTDTGKLARLVDRGIRTGPAPEDARERAEWSRRLTHGEGEQILASLGEKPQGRSGVLATRLRRALGKTPVAERRLQEQGFVSRDALAERAAAPKVDTQAPTERIVKPAPEPAARSAAEGQRVYDRLVSEIPAETLSQPVNRKGTTLAEALKQFNPQADPAGVEGNVAQLRMNAESLAKRATKSVPAKPAARRAFDVQEEPSSPTYTNRVRERVREAIARRRTTGGTELRPGVDPLIAELGDQPSVDTNTKVSAAVRKRVVTKAKVNGKDTTLYEAPNGWGKSINEYVELYRKHGRLLRSEQRVRESQGILDRRALQLSELPADAPADSRNRAVALRDKAAAEHEAVRSKLTSARASKNPPSAAELERLRALSNGIRGQFAEGIAKQAAELIRGTPAGQREAVAARLEKQIETGTLEDLISDELVDPSTLSGVNARVFLADVGESFALVSPHPKKPGEFQTLDRTGALSTSDPFVTDQLGDLLDVLSVRDLQAPVSAAVSNAEGLAVAMAASEIRAGQRGAPAVTDKSMAPKEWETAELFLNRILMTDTNGDVSDAGTRRVKSVNAAELERVVADKFGDPGVATLADYVRVKAIAKTGDKYVSQNMSQFYRRSGPSMTGSGDANPSTETVLSEQKQIELAAVLFDLDVRTGMRHGVVFDKGISGVYDMNARSVALGQFDLGTFFHELFHDVTIDEIGKRSTPMPKVQLELVKVATDHKQPALMSEGAAELGRVYVQDPALAHQQYPNATRWMEGLLASRGLKTRVDSVVSEHQKWLAASPETRRKAAIISKDELEARDKTANIGSLWFKTKSFLSTRLFDRVANLRAVTRELPPPKDAYDDAYEAKMLEGGWAKAAADTFINGPILDARTGVRSASFGAVMDQATQLGLTPEAFTDWQAYMAGMSIFDKSPRLRRKIFSKLGIAEDSHGAWAIPDAYLPDPFETLDEIVAANLQMDLDWEAKAQQNKTLGKPAPPKPVPYKVVDPSPGSSENAPTNFTQQQLEDFANVIKQHDIESPFHTLAETHMEAVNALDAWKHANGMMTKSSLRSHQAHAYYVPLRTETADGQRMKIKGSGGAEIIAPYEQLWDKVRTDHFYLYSQSAPRAWLRYVTGIRADRVASGSARDEDIVPLAKLASFTSMDEAVRNYAAISSRIKKTGQESPVVDEYVIITLDGDTIDALSAAGLINPLLVKDPNSLIGTHIAYRVEDPEIRSALGDPTIPWAPAMHWILRGPASALRKLTTVFNPEFWVKTVVRDTYQAGLQTAAGRNPLRFAKTTGQGIVDAYTNAAKLGSDRAKTDPIFAQFVQSGVTSSSLLADASNVTAVLGNHDLSRALSMMGAHQPRFGWLRSLASPLNRVADTVEGFNRASEFRRAVTDGLAKAKATTLDQVSERQARAILIQAARAAQEVTVNFRRMGSWSPIRSLNEVVPFFNATIQGSMRGIKALTFQERFPGESAGARLVNGLTIYTLLALPVLLQHLLLGDSDDRDQYSKLPDNERMLFYHFPVGKDAAEKTRFARIPKPQGVFTGVIAAWEKLMADDPRTWSDIGADTFAQTAPQSYVPTSLQLGLELFNGTRIGSPASRVGVPYRLQGVEGDTQDTPWLSPSSYAVANSMQALGWNMSPLTAENLLRGYTGGLGWTVLDVPPTLQDLVGKHERASYDAGSYPVTRLFMTRDPAFASRSITRVYDLLDVLNSQRKTYEAEVRRAEVGQQTPDDAVKNILDRPLTGFGKQADDELADFRVQLGKSRTLWESINRDATLDPIRRRIEMDKVVEQIVDASRLVYKTVSSMAEETGVKLKVPRR